MPFKRFLREEEWNIGARKRFIFNRRADKLFLGDKGLYHKERARFHLTVNAVSIFSFYILGVGGVSFWIDGLNLSE